MKIFVFWSNFLNYTYTPLFFLTINHKQKRVHKFVFFFDSHMKPGPQISPKCNKNTKGASNKQDIYNRVSML